MSISITQETKNRFVTVAIAGESVNTAATSPGTMADDATVGTVAWSLPDRAMASDDIKTLAACTVIEDPFSATSSHYLKATNFGFSIPTGSTIDGILVEIEKKALDGAGTVEDDTVKIVKAGTIGSTDKSNVDNWPSSDTYISHGSSSDLWGETWTAEDINLSTFGVVVSAQGIGAGTNRRAQVDHIRITVYYTTAGTPATFSLENKLTGGTFGSSPGRTFADGGTFGEPGTFLAKDGKNVISISNENKV